MKAQLNPERADKQPRTSRDQRILDAAKSILDKSEAKSERDFLIKLGFNPSLLSKMRAGIQSAPDGFVSILASKFGVNLEYIQFGNGQMFTSSSASGAINGASTSHNDASLLSNDLIVRTGPDTPRPIYSGLLNALPVPLVGAKVQAGFAESFLDDTSREELDVYPYIYITDEPDLKDPWAFEVRGDSMEPTLHRGNIVVATPVPDGNVQHVSGGLFVLVYAIDGYADLVVKRIKNNDLSSGGTVTLHSDNPVGGNLTLRRADIRAMWKVRRAVIEF